MLEWPHDKLNDLDEEKEKRLKWLRKQLPPRPVHGFLDDIRCALMAIEESIRGPQGSQDRRSYPGEGEGGSKKREGAIDQTPKENTPLPHHIVWSGEFARAVRRAGVKVVVLSTCESAWRDQEQFSWSGVAAALLRAGIPVVVGMQFSISDAAAIAFSGAFYRAIARGLSVDEAVGHGRAAMTEEARKDLDEDLNEGKVPDPGGEADNFLSDFGLPVLYVRSPQVQSFAEIRDVYTDPLPMTERFRDLNQGFEAFIGRSGEKQGGEPDLS